MRVSLSVLFLVAIPVLLFAWYVFGMGGLIIAALISFILLQAV